MVTIAKRVTSCEFLQVTTHPYITNLLINSDNFVGKLSYSLSPFRRNSSYRNVRCSLKSRKIYSVLVSS